MSSPHMPALSMSPVYPPLDGSVLITDMIDFHIKHNASLPCYVYADESEPHHVHSVSYLDLGRAVQRAARVLKEVLGSTERQVVAFIAPLDTLYYQTIVLGLMRAGFIPFPMSPRNSPPAIVNLLRKTSCVRLIAVRDSLNALIEAVERIYITESRESHFHGDGLMITEPPSFSALYPQFGCETQDNILDVLLPWPAKLDDVALYQHSSGSSGFPKPIPLSHLTVLHWGLCFPSSVREFAQSFRMGGMALPGFHALGFATQVISPLLTALSGLTRGRPMIPDPVNVLEHMRWTESNALMIVPTFLQMWSEDPSAVNYLKSLDVVAFAGGAISPSIGQALVDAGIHLSPIYGGTEFGAPLDMFPRKGTEHTWDWEWMRAIPGVKPRWIPQGDGTYECHLLTCETHQLSIENLPDTKGYATADLFVKHPTKEGYWKIVGRVDDVIVHATGEKTVPAPMENMMTSSPLIEGAVMFGREQDQAGVLIEPSHALSDEAEIESYKEQIWPVIEAVNKEAPAFSRIFKNMILISSPQKVLQRAAKGTVMRKAALKAYEQEIRNMYDSHNPIVQPKPSGTTADGGPEDLEKWISDMVHSLGVTVNAEDDLFVHGLDSLSANALRNRIIQGFSERRDTGHVVKRFEQNLVYAHPSIKSLAAFLAQSIAKPARNKRTIDDGSRITQLIDKYATISTDAAVLLTGSTGGLGCFLLAELLSRVNVSRVYAFNRASSSGISVLDRQRAAFLDRGLDEGLLTSKRLVFIEGDTSDPTLGLKSGVLEELRASVTTVIHNAWRVDFNLSLSSFEPNILGLVHLIALAKSSGLAGGMRLVFVSSVAAAQSWELQNGPVPDLVLENPGVAVGTGYGEGKFACEQILAKSGISASSVRIGQICGSGRNGHWSNREWVPIIIKSSIKLGGLPIATGSVSWLLAESVAKGVVDMTMSPSSPMPWKSIVEEFSTELKAQKITLDALPLIPLREWLTRLEKYASTSAADLDAVPASKLISFFRALEKSNSMADHLRLEVEAFGFPTFCTENVRACCPSIATARPLGGADVKRWVEFWKRSKWLDTM
ncbi:hypothetical protein DFH29DRAFT_957159 [Suillus ampliporus]|nr:hypothetical protein DFH29DRAFT_957159 [Suillus ampliporus]